ncbi:MAG: LCP family protein [Thermoleophilia bacterium]|nr:LCP family protein [Thermoleophilia bacterium]
MADAEKPYRLYKGGRVKGKVPTAPRPERTSKAEAGRPKAPGRPRWRRRVGIAVLLLAVFLVVWIVASYLAFRKGVGEANERLPKTVSASLAAQEGLLTSKPSLIMLLGTDGDKTAARQDFRRSDSILLVRTDPKRHRMSYLSIPRDLRVDVPGYGANKINAAFQLGGPALTMKTVRALTGLQPNHVVLVDFDNFKDVIDALGGVEIDVPKPILSNRFDCPYPTEARCRQWEGWRFAKGKQTMGGKRALIYSRIRENRLDPAENDLTRGERQQDVVEAMTNKLVSPGTFLKLPFVGDDLVKPLATDLSAGQLLQLGWVRFRSNEGRSLHCRLGGEAQSIGGESVLVGGEDNTATIAMFTGRSAAQPPPPGTTFGAGCRVGRSVD